MAYFRRMGDERPVVAARSLAFTSSAAHVTIDAPSDGLVVLTQQMGDGWRATIDGVAAETVQAGVFRAVRLGAGHHTIIWRYRPLPLFAGAFVTIAAAMLLLFSRAFVKHRASQEKV